MLVVNPWDKATIHDIEKAIQASGLGLNPSNDGQIIRVPIPALTADRRKGLVKQVGEKLEESRVRARTVRREYNEIFKGMENDKEITEDESKRYVEKVQSSTDTAIADLSAMATAKEKEVLEG
jgi:ribosome recycling factor